MLVRSLKVAALIFICQIALAQPGNYFLTHHTPSDERIDYVTYGMAQDQKGVIYFANKSGVLEFDGRNWSLISTPGPIYSVATHGDNVYAAGYNGFGRLNWKKETGWSYEPLSTGLPNSTQFFASHVLNNNAYFLNHDAVFVFDGTKAQGIKATDDTGPLTGLFEIAGEIYIHGEKGGFFKIANNQLVNSAFTLPAREVPLFANTLPGKDNTMIGTESGRIFLYDGKILTEVPCKDRAFLQSNVVVGGTWVSESLIAVATLRGGVIFIKPDTGTTEEITNFYTGLSDNEVYAILCDRNRGVWIANDYGFTRIAPYLPFKSYNHYPGLEGNLLCAITHNEKIYVGTTLGLFMLQRKEVYEAPQLPVDTKVNRQVQGEPEQASGKKGLFAFLRKQKKERDESGNSVEASRKPAYVKPQKPVLKAIQYAFKKIPGADGKITQFVEANGKLLAAGTVGVIEVDDATARQVTDTPIRSMFLSPSLKQLLVSTLDEQIRTFSAEGKGWKETHLLDSIQDYISYMFEDKIQNIWLCSRTSVYKVETIDGEITAVESIPYPNPSIDETTGLAYGSEVYVAASGTFNRYNVAKNDFAKYDSLPGPKKYFASAGYFWFHDGHRWRTVDPRMQAALKLEWLSLFPSLRFIAPAGNEGLWIVTANNELYKFASNKVATEQLSYPLFLREVRSQQNKLAPAHTVVVSQLESTVTFEFIQPDFLGMKAVEYRYLINGLTKAWSAWSTDNNVVNFSYLPVGNYKVEVQTRDLMGKISDVEEIELKVEPPYWKRSWFYAAEFAFFGILVFVSIRVSRANSRYALVSRVLSLLTVIMLIQFVQTVVASQISLKSTPVIEFFVQVFIALLVLPIEEFLRNYIVRTPAKVEEPAEV